MKTVVLASAVALGLSTGAAFATTSTSGDVSTDATPTSCLQTARRFNSVGTLPVARQSHVRRVAPSWSNPTGQLVRGRNGAISLYAPTDNGGD